MAKLQDKFFNRVIEGDLELGQNETNQVVKAVEDASALNVFENITDKDGHKRFVEGDGTPLEQEGFTSSYCKWSLSGTHLMLVLAGNVSANTELPTTIPLAEFELPQWIMNKIYAVQGNLLEYKTIVLVKINYATLEIPAYLDKGTNTMKIYGNYGNLIEDACAFRISFDLLIDNE